MATQYGEDAIILQHFEGRPGRFLDVGAGDGLVYSNTEPLLRAGWSGVMVEPAPSQLRWLYENHGDNPKVVIVPYALGDGIRPRCVNFWDGGHDGKDFSTTNVAHRNLVATQSAGDVKFTERRVMQLSWWDMQGIAPGPFDFVNIDVEGNNVEVLASMPWGLVAPEMICIEIDPAYQEDWMRGLLRTSGLAHQVKCGGNLIAWK